MLGKNQILGPDDIRTALRSWVHNKFELKQNDILINELGFWNKDPESTVDCSFRADLALANGRLVGFEIKSQKDTLKRWTSQMTAYSNVFEEIWLCSHGKHLHRALEITDKHIGVLAVDDSGSITVVRYAAENTKLNFYDLSGLLWKDELLTFASLNNIKEIKSRMTKNEIREVLSAHSSLNELKPYVLQKLKERKS
ncbi:MULTISPECIES: sce7726 family protein [Acinetobacter]|uniref:sce7726 family protein n=1 Tax=Acinetobacter TaxID=469 RepID=UPI0015D0ECB7|nr:MULTISPECIES: sce7726 family protein [Acinetobacter]